MQVGGKLVGVLNVSAIHPRRPFALGEVKALSILTGTAASAIENAFLYEQVRNLNASLERRVRERTAQLQEANNDLEAFSYSVSHDLRSPLRHLDGFAELLRTSRLNGRDDESERYIQTISQSAKQMGRLIDDLLSFSRVGREAIRAAVVNIAELVDEVKNELNQDTRGCAIEWKVGLLPEVQGDPGLLRLVLTNLLSNAVKYTSTRTEAHIEIGSTNGNQDETVFFVRDNGVGFDMKYVHKLFGVFQRLHRADEFEGTGIGLANVQRIIHRHGGKTWAEGVVDGGATFYFTLPQTSGSREDEVKG
jgi:light-regulated signal transduction histidine kinase (bacteriophytochrome)